MGENEISRIVVDSAFALHKELGPGLLELVYEVALAHELRERGLRVERQVPVELVYRGVRFNEGFRLDLKVQSKVIVEIKCANRVTDVHKKQLLTYLRMTGCRLGLLLNFGQSLMKDGTVRIVNKLDDTI
jgi:GxxExxY protein